MRYTLFWHRLTHWEYWPLWAIYYPLFPVWLYLSAKARSFFFFNAVNPSMKNGGMAMESKMEIYENIPRKYIPNTFLVKKGTTLHAVSEQIKKRNIQFPCIAKPDIGMKAFAVEKLYGEEDVQRYLEKTPSDFLVQEFIPYRKEVGIFYVRYPGESKGKITGIVAKDFLTVKGDGRSSLLELIKQDPRSHIQLDALRERLGESELATIPEKGLEHILVPYGSHTRGAKFLDRTHLNNAELEKTLNTICAQIDGFYYGRLDILCSSFDSLSKGKDFKVIEVNGAGSEATHIYDPKHSLFFAWGEIIRHWNHMCNISIINHKKGYPYLSYKAGRTMLREHVALESQLKLI
ncbi:MAG: D-alanine--D-alanine ligase [Bacteroidota bacterium]